MTFKVTARGAERWKQGHPWIYRSDVVEEPDKSPGIVPVTGIVALLACGYFLRKQRDGWAFAMTCITIIFALVTMFMILYPRVMISSTDPAYSLTIYNASSSQYTLTVMSIVALVFVPIVLAYQGWTYYMFRKRITAEKQSLVY